MSEQDTKATQRKTVQKRLAAVRFLSFILILLLMAGGVSYLIINESSALNTVKSILMVMIGFGAVIMIHEFGHFIVAKLSGIKVEAFSIGFAPTLLGIRKSSKGMKFSFLGSGSGDDSDSESKSDEEGTEYRLGLLPFGGYVKMLGQEDVGSAESSDDPRSFANKSVWVRIGVVAAGVLFNAISAVFIFMIVFLASIKLPPAVVGGVRPDSPAETAGLGAGDRIIKVGNESFVDFGSLLIAGALSGKGEPVDFTVAHSDGTVKEVEMIARRPRGSDLRLFGIEPGLSLEVAPFEKPEDNERLYGSTGLKSGDIVTAVNGKPIEHHWQMEKIISESWRPVAELTVKRRSGEGEMGGLVTEQVEIPLVLNHAKDNFDSGYTMTHIFGMVPRLKIVWAPKGHSLKRGDIIVKAGEQNNPTFRELRDVTVEHADKVMKVMVLREESDGEYAEKTFDVEVSTVPGGGAETARMGIVPALDGEHSVVADTIDVQGGIDRVEIPSGARIEKVDGEKVDSFYEVIRLIGRRKGERVAIDYRIDAEQAGSVVLNVPANDAFITARPQMEPPGGDGLSSTAYVPFAPLKEVYKADGPVEAVQMGLKKTWSFIAQTYVTLRRLATREVSPKTLVGPVGIVTMSYQIASSQPPMYYVYFLGLISSVIAVMNLLPLPIVDGGVIVLLLIEKIKGSPISERTQATINYIGLVFIAIVFILLLWNDIMRFFVQ